MIEKEVEEEDAKGFEEKRGNMRYQRNAGQKVDELMTLLRLGPRVQTVQNRNGHNEALLLLLLLWSMR